MITKIPKCKKCKKDMRDFVILTDNTEDNFTQFALSYCPHCIELEDKIEATVWAKTIKGDKK